jgi:glycosyltransferase involved in cell wall biosynthesis
LIKYYHQSEKSDSKKGNELALNKPLVSVIVPVYNGESFLAEAVDSIQQQSYQPLEIIIVDDGSTDSTKQLATAFGESVRYVYQTNSGPAAARNTGIGLARGVFIAFLDSDDLWSEDKLNLQLALLAENPSVEIALGYTQMIRLIEPNFDKPEFELYLKPWLPLSLGSALIKKTAFDRVGVFDETQFFCDDVDWFIRAKELGVLMMTHREVTLYYRRHSNNLTNQRQLDQKYFMLALKKSLDRRRQRNKSQTCNFMKRNF